jgi:hypothetical protein
MIKSENRESIRDATAEMQALFYESQVRGVIPHPYLKSTF